MTPVSFRPLAAVAIAAALIATTLAASAQQADRPPSGLLDRIFGGGDSSPSASGRVAQVTDTDLVVRLERLEAQIRQLTGVIEQLQFRNQQLEGQLRRMQENSEFRDPRSQAPPRPAGAPATAQPPIAAPGRRGDAFDPSQNPTAPGAPRTLGSTSVPPGAPAPQAPDPAAGEAPIGAPGGRAAGAPLDLSTLAAGAVSDPSLSAPAPAASPDGALPPPPPRTLSATGAQVATAPPSDSPKDNFDLAYGYVLRRDYALAEEGFRTFLKRFPSDRLAPDAQYWLGESLFQRQRYRDAAEAFLNVSTKYETTAKAPEALLRLGQSLAALGEKEAACASLGEVLRKYPRASIGVRQGVAREQRRARC